nr:MAG TPA: hypothetical protein [Caudoviricetes sp.]
MNIKKLRTCLLCKHSKQRGLTDKRIKIIKTNMRKVRSYGVEFR